MTPAAAAAALEGAQRLAPGIWRDRRGFLHFSVPEILKHLDWPDTPAHRELVNQVVSDLVATMAPDATIVENELEN